MNYDNTNTGVLFPNDKKGNDRRPDFTGKVNVNGVEYQLAAWKKSSREGNPFLSLSVKPMQTRDDRKPEHQANAEPSGPNTTADQFDDDIPF